jgi:uncharacterized protein
VKGLIKPSNVNERIHAIDIVRGFALLGIFIVNMPAFFSPILYIDQQKAAETMLDRSIVIFIDIFAQANFYTLFSFLFGFGTIMFYERVLQKELKPKPYLLRRFSFLLVLGLIHMMFIWHGDILISYSIVAAILLFFLKVQAKNLLLIVAGVIFIPYILVGILVALSGGGGSVPEKPAHVQEMQDIYQSGTYVEITMQRIADWLHVHGGIGMVFIILTLLPMFLLGAYFAKEKIFHHVSENKRKLKRIAIVSLSLGLLIKLLPYMTENPFLSMLQDGVGGPLMAIGYATTIVLLVEANIGILLLAPLRYVGRMSLSNYLLQSIICTFIFYSYGLGLYGEISYKTGFVLTFLIFIGQIFFSRWWLVHYQYGPFEWLWRIVTYKKVLFMKRGKSVPSGE